MSDLPRQKLCDLIAIHGTSLCDDARRLEAFLRDACSGYRREVNALTIALKERITGDLRIYATNAIETPDALLRRLTQRLCADSGLDENISRWAVESWALALKAVSAEQLAPPGVPQYAGPASVYAPIPHHGLAAWSCPSCRQSVAAGSTYCPHCGYNAALYSPPVRQQRSTGWIATAILCGLVSVLFCPPLFGGIAIYAGYQVKKGGNEGAGVALMIVCSVLMVFGIVVGVVVGMSAFQMR